jgi:hypothetical protein
VNIGINDSITGDAIVFEFNMSGDASLVNASAAFATCPFTLVNN